MAWAVDVAVITAIDGPAEPVDYALFLFGLAALPVATVLAGLASRKAGQAAPECWPGPPPRSACS